MKGVRTDVAVAASIRTGARVGKARELVIPNLPKVVLDDVLAMREVGSEPGRVSGCAARAQDTLDVSEGVAG